MKLKFSMGKSLILFILLFVVSSCQMTPDYEMKGQVNNEFVGHWYGEVWKEGRVTKFLAHHKLNGEFIVHFKYYEVNQLMIEQKEYGEWSYDKGYLYTEANKIVNLFNQQSRQVFYREKYKVLEKTSDYFKYKSDRTGAIFEKKKVGIDFEF